VSERHVAEAAVRVSRRDHLAPRVVFVDGIEGCGKTMLSPILSALDRAELLTYAYEIENIVSLNYLGKLDDDAAEVMISILADLQIYNSMQSREVNFRPSDLSSVFRASQPLRYVRRLFLPGDSAAAERIAAENPILMLTTHRMIAYCEPIFRALGRRAAFVEVVRHPLYMVIQNSRNFSDLIGTARDFTVYYDYNGNDLPYFVRGWEDRFLAANAVERAIYSIQHLSARSDANRSAIRNASESTILTIPFEKFVVAPDPYMKLFEESLDTTVTRYTRRMMAKQRVPRTKYADSIDLAVYRRCGWEPPKKGLTEREEFEYRRIWAETQASPDAMRVLDTLCDQYEETYMGGPLRTNGGSYI
jgi:hypothetical protein